MNWFKNLLCPASLCKLILTTILGIACLTVAVSVSAQQNTGNFYNHHAGYMNGDWGPYNMPMMRGYWYPDNASMTGNWQIEYPISAESINVFNESIKDINNGYTYKPIAVAQQVINGMNYIYIAIAKPTVNNNNSGEQIVKIHIISTPAGADPKVMRIMPITP